MRYSAVYADTFSYTAKLTGRLWRANDTKLLSKEAIRWRQEKLLWS